MGGNVMAKSVSESEVDPPVISEGEELLYDVSWLFVKIGQIRVETLEPKKIGDETQYVGSAYIDSYPGLPLVDLHAISYTNMTPGFYSRGYRSLERKGNEWWTVDYHYDIPNNVLVIEENWKKDLASPPYKSPKLDTIRIEHEWLEDALSLLYFARANVRGGRKLSVPTIAYSKAGVTRFDFTGDRTTEKIAAFDKPIRVVEFEGKAEFEGLLGFTGDFKGTFSDDAAAVPIKAQMKVILGNIKIELKEWKRKGWSPPTE
jgi:hypothetical protein